MTVFIEIKPLSRLVARNVVSPITNSILLIEGCVVWTDVRNASSKAVAHVKELTFEIHICVKPDRAIFAVELNVINILIVPSLCLRKRKM